MFQEYPAWARQLAQKYLGRTLNQFILHGNVHDLVPLEGDEARFERLQHFLAHEFFGARDYVIFYDRASGITFRDRQTQQDFNQALAGHDTLMGTNYAGKMPKEPLAVFNLLEQYARLRLADAKSLAIIIDYAETIVPMQEGGSAGAEDRTARVYLQRWSKKPLFMASDFTTVLVTENLADINAALVQHPHTAAVRIAMPNKANRRAFISSETADESWEALSDVPVDVLAQQTAGLNFTNIRSLLAKARQNEAPLTANSLRDAKKEYIEAEAYGLLEFVEHSHTLDQVAGHGAVKAKLRQAIKALSTGRHDVLPMGYLICGPVGTGKTFLVNCFANEVGIPMVKLKNFRSQWQGVTEGNLEKILELLKAMAPVAVMIDEADAYLGNRNQNGDSGVSSRVFSQIASFMSDTSHRGRILWFLMTARPDLMPVDLKRQGRAEEHFPLFPPHTKEDRLELFRVMKNKTGLQQTTAYVPDIITNGSKTLSGADMEAALTRAKFQAAAAGERKVSPEILDAALDDFLPPNYPEEIELQTLSAVIECTSKSLLPSRYQAMDRNTILAKIEQLKLKMGA